MSTYSKIRKHPQTGEYEMATFVDDYFGPHIYGVHFSSDDKTYPVELVESKQVYDFWKDDVILAYCYLMGFAATDEGVITFLNQIEKQYKARWERDPVTGEGATLHSKIVYGRD